MTSAEDDTREGKGRARPGPSPSAHSRPQGRDRGGSNPWSVSAGLLVVLFAAAASSVLGTQAHQYSSPTALTVTAAVGAFLGTLLAVGLPTARPRSVRGWLLAMCCGVAGFALAPWMVMANRYTDAPPGSEVLLFSVVGWGALLAVALALTSRQRIVGLGGVLVALAGAAMVLGNWERPSSFSPLVRYAREEMLMLAAGAFWVALLLVLVRAVRRGEFKDASIAAAFGGLLGAGVLVAIALMNGNFDPEHLSDAGTIGYGIATAVGVSGALFLLRERAAYAVAAAYLLVPGTVSLLLALEWTLGPYGPQPMLLGPVAAGVVATAAGVVVGWPDPGSSHGKLQRGAAWRWLAIIVGAGALVSATAALASPSMTAAVQGLRTDGSQFRASFDLFGYEIAGPWLALGAAVAALGLALGRPRVRALWPRLAGLIAAIAAWWVGGMTPLRTLVSFIPSDVQVDYGSEFARIDFTGAPSLLVVCALGGALASIALTWVANSGSHEAGIPVPADAAPVSGEESRGDRS